MKIKIFDILIYMTAFLYISLSIWLWTKTDVDLFTSHICLYLSSKKHVKVIWYASTSTCRHKIIYIKKASLDRPLWYPFWVWRGKKLSILIHSHLLYMAIDVWWPASEACISSTRTLKPIHFPWTSNVCNAVCEMVLHLLASLKLLHCLFMKK